MGIIKDVIKAVVVIASSVYMLTKAIGVLLRRASVVATLELVE